MKAMTTYHAMHPPVSTLHIGSSRPGIPVVKSKHVVLAAQLDLYNQLDSNTHQHRKSRGYLQSATANITVSLIVSIISARIR